MQKRNEIWKKHALWEIEESSVNPAHDRKTRHKQVNIKKQYPD